MPSFLSAGTDRDDGRVKAWQDHAGEQWRFPDNLKPPPHPTPAGYMGRRCLKAFHSMTGTSTPHPTHIIAHMVAEVPTGVIGGVSYGMSLLCVVKKVGKDAIPPGVP